MVNQPCILGIHPTWSWWIIFLMYCWILLASILLRIFASMFIRDIGLYSPFWWGLCLVLELRWCWPHRTNLEVLSLFLSFQTALVEWVWFLLETFDRIPQGSHLALDFCVLGGFWWLLQFTPWLLACLGLLFLPVPVLVVCGFPEMHPFLLDYLIYWGIATHNKF